MVRHHGGHRHLLRPRPDHGGSAKTPAYGCPQGIRRAPRRDAAGAGAKVLGPITIAAGARVGSNAVVTKAVPAGATAVGNPARVVDRSEESRQRQAQAEKLGFSAYAVALDQDDPLSKAIHGLLDHAAETDRRLASLLKELEAAGVKCDEEVLAADRFDPNYLSKIVD